MGKRLNEKDVTRTYVGPDEWCTELVPVFRDTHRNQEIFPVAITAMVQLFEDSEFEFVHEISRIRWTSI